MTTESNTEGETPLNEGSEPTLEDQLKQLQEHVATLSSTNERLLRVSKEEKEKRQGLESSVVEKEKEKLVSQGKLKELIQLEKEEHEATKGRFQSMKSKLMKERLRNEISMYAKDTHSVDDILNQDTFYKFIEADEENMTFANVKDGVEAVRKSNPYLFQANQVTPMANGIPETQIAKTGNFNEEIKTAQNQKEFEAIRKKYGRA
jgi:hypothetical protein